MISFRLTDEEYERFRRLCLARGLRNVSELVRTAVNQMLENSPVPNSEIEFRVGRLESQVADLNLAVEQMERRISADEGFKRAATN
jgi:hypothetical protein